MKNPTEVMGFVSSPIEFQLGNRMIDANGNDPSSLHYGFDAVLPSGFASGSVPVIGIDAGIDAICTVPIRPEERSRTPMRSLLVSGRSINC